MTTVRVVPRPRIRPRARSSRSPVPSPAARPRHRRRARLDEISGRGHIHRSRLVPLVRHPSAVIHPPAIDDVFGLDQSPVVTGHAVPIASHRISFRPPIDSIGLDRSRKKKRPTTREDSFHDSSTTSYVPRGRGDRARRSVRAVVAAFVASVGRRVGRSSRRSSRRVVASSRRRVVARLVRSPPFVRPRAGGTGRDGTGG